jgi:hypothetical protein
MIQRIQSIFLLLASLSGGALFILPFASAPKTTDGIFADGLFNIHDNIGLLILTALVAVIALVSIFLFNNRKLQMNVGKLNLVLSLALMSWAAYLFFTMMATAAFGVGLVMPVVLMIMTVLANRNILKDERLVRSADRIR